MRAQSFAPNVDYRSTTPERSERPAVVAFFFGRDDISLSGSGAATAPNRVEGHSQQHSERELLTRLEAREDLRVSPSNLYPQSAPSLPSLFQPSAWGPSSIC